MGNQGQRIIVRESDAPEAPFACITIQAKDLRPFVLRRWSGTGIAGVWSLDDRSFGAYYWRARSRESLVAKALKRLRRDAIRLGIQSPVIAVTDADPLKDAPAEASPHALKRDFDAAEVPPPGGTYHVEVIATGGGAAR